VRNGDELENDGKIPGSFNIPLPEIEKAFSMNQADFFDMYNFQLPEKDVKNVVLSCSSGRRAATARKILEEIGYPFLILYEGSFLDWNANGGDII